MSNKFGNVVPLMNKVSPSKSLSLLRKALSNSRYSGEISFLIVDNYEWSTISVLSGNILTDHDTIGHLRDLLTKDISSCEFSSKKSNEDVRDIRAPLAFSHVINDIHWSEERLMAFKKLFCKLPPVSVSIASMHDYGYNDGLTYLTLLQASRKKDAVFTLQSFLSETHTFTTLEQKIKVLVLAYCLSLISPIIDHKKETSKQQVIKKLPLKKSLQSRKRKRFHSGMASTILNKLRGL